MGNKLQYIQVYTTVAKSSDAKRLAQLLSEKKLSACTQILGPITSMYKWEGKLVRSKEWLCIIKTKKEKYQNIEKVIKSIHPYKLPEIIAVPILKGSLEYLGWIKNEV